MTDVLLSDLVQQLREQVKAGQYPAAFALGRHILQHYPKHIDTYVLLAQASLETDDIASATDLYRRVLSTDPENVLALAGMAVLNETQEKHDEALWYLERAFELQPQNDQIRSELLRLREAFYGTAPSRLELTGGGLARLYARQGQYAQAANELRRVLRADPERYDARVALAEVLYRSGRTDEAAQAAQAVMADAPFALKPNLILGQLWTENNVPEAQEFVSRAQALDPEGRTARAFLGTQFEAPQPPRLPAPEDGVVPSPTRAVDAGATPSGSPPTASRAAGLLRDIEVAQSAPMTGEPTLAELDVLALVQADLPTPSVQGKPFPVSEAPSIELAATRTVMPTAAVLPEPALPSAETVALPSASPQPEPLSSLSGPTSAPNAGSASPTLTPAPAQQSELAVRLARAKRASESVEASTIAAAANALAASIALDKANQPAPARRAHPAIPKVRPVIRGAAEKLAPWLRLSSTPAAAPASFDAPAATGETGQPGGVAETTERPDWLVQAQAAASLESTAPPPEPALPDWLRAAAERPSPKSSADVAPLAGLPDWLHEPGSTETRETTAPVQNQPQNAFSDRLADSTPVTPSVEPLPASPTADETPAMEIPGGGVEPRLTAADEPLTLDADASAAQAPTDAKLQTSATTAASAEKPADALSLIESARERYARQDVKGALDLYERAMHRRPGQLELVITDLQALVANPGATSSAHRLLGEALAMAGRFKESLEQYRLAMSK